MIKKLLVVGAKPGSLGEAIVRRAEDDGFHVITAGLGEGLTGGNELDVTNPHRVRVFFEEHYAPNVVCTVGVNQPDASWTFQKALRYHMDTNAIGVLNLCQEWIRHIRRAQTVELLNWRGNFIAISSNSAHIARSGSAAYCASKAALSMGIRCIARREAQTEEDRDLPGVNVWGYEPGWINDTPMSHSIQSQFPDIPLHRIPGNRVLSASVLAARIVHDLTLCNDALNGNMVRIDGGEQ